MQLSERLEKPQPDADIGSFAPATQALSVKLDLLAKSMADEIGRINTARSKEDWEAATAAAAVPFSDSGELALRSRLWARLDNIREHDRDPASDNPRSSRLSDKDRVAEARNARRRAQIQGVMALSALGARWFDDKDSKIRGQGDYDATIKRVRGVNEGADERAESWEKPIAEAADLIGQRWRQMAPVIDDLRNEENGIKDFTAFEEQLTKADRLGRMIDGAAPPLDESHVDATVRLRQARVHDLLLALAQRTWLDHWYGEDAKENPYYRIAGSAFVSDASKLVANSPLVRATQARLDQKGSLEISGTFAARDHQRADREPGLPSGSSSGGCRARWASRGQTGAGASARARGRRTGLPHGRAWHRERQDRVLGVEPADPPGGNRPEAELGP